MKSVASPGYSSMQEEMQKAMPGGARKRMSQASQQEWVSHRFSGESLWGPMQLEEEMATGYWICVRPNGSYLTHLWCRAMPAVLRYVLLLGALEAQERVWVGWPCWQSTGSSGLPWQCTITTLRGGPETSYTFCLIVKLLHWYCRSQGSVSASQRRMQLLWRTLLADVGGEVAAARCVTAKMANDVMSA